MLVVSVKIVGIMNADALTSVFIRHLNYNLPAMIVMISGLVWTIMSWRRHPPAARWALAAFIWMLITYLLAICWYSFGILFLLHNELPLNEQTVYIMALSCCEGVGYLLFILALNSARYPYRPPQYYDHFPEDDEPPRTS